MSSELVYTSVPSGLKPGSKGFCTVAMTAGLSAGWVDRLESLSAYRAVFPLGDPKSDRNPVNFSHWRVSIAGKTRSVLSRVAFDGADYSGRSNKIAHHIVLETPTEQAPEGPAWMLLNRSLMRTKWTETPLTIPSGPSITAIARTPHPCTTWASVRGDAGWGGKLAESFVTDPAKPAYLIYAPGTDVLKLFDESLSLLPPAKRWEVTFSTFFTELPLNLSCAWRAVVAGTPAAVEATRQGPRVFLMDITKPATGIASGPYADAARAGNGPVVIDMATRSSATPKKLGNTTPSLDSEDTRYAMEAMQDELKTAVPLGKKKRILIHAKSLVEEDDEIFDFKENSTISSKYNLRQPRKSEPSASRWILPTVAGACVITLAGIIAGLKLKSHISKSGVNIGEIKSNAAITVMSNPSTRNNDKSLGTTIHPAALNENSVAVSPATKSLVGSPDKVATTPTHPPFTGDIAPTTSAITQPGSLAVIKTPASPTSPVLIITPSLEDEIQNAKSDRHLEALSVEVEPMRGSDSDLYSVDLPPECSKAVGFGILFPNGQDHFPIIVGQSTDTLTERRIDPLTLNISTPVSRSLDVVDESLVKLQVVGGKILITINPTEKRHSDIALNIIKAMKYTRFLVRIDDGKTNRLMQYLLKVTGETQKISGKHNSFELPHLPDAIQVRNFVISGGKGDWILASGEREGRFVCPLQSDGITAEFTVKSEELNKGEVHIDNAKFFQILQSKKTADGIQEKDEKDVQTAQGLLDKKKQDKDHQDPAAIEKLASNLKVAQTTLDQDKTLAAIWNKKVTDWQDAYNAASAAFPISLCLPNGSEVKKLEITLPRLVE